MNEQTLIEVLFVALDGAAVVGNSYITWINAGTRYGAIT